MQDRGDSRAVTNKSGRRRESAQEQPLTDCCLDLLIMTRIDASR